LNRERMTPMTYINPIAKTRVVQAIELSSNDRAFLSIMLESYAAEIDRRFREERADMAEKTYEYLWKERRDALRLNEVVGGI